MLSTSAILALASILSTASASNIFVDNLCSTPVYLRSSASSPKIEGNIILLPPNTRNAYYEVQRDPTYAVNALTVSLNADLSFPIQATYSQSNNQLTYYALSTIYGDPFKTTGFEYISDAGQSIVCTPRTSGDCPSTYSPSNPQGNGAVFTQPTGHDLTLKLCRSGGSKSDKKMRRLRTRLQ